jgi:hypothetical protein
MYKKIYFFQVLYILRIPQVVLIHQCHLQPVCMFPPPLQAIPLVILVASVPIILQPQMQHQMMEEWIHCLALEITIHPALEMEAQVLKVLCNFANTRNLRETFSCSMMRMEDVNYWLICIIAHH